MPVNSILLPVGGMSIYSPWWVARLLQRATTLSPSAMRSSMVLITSGKPRRKSAASCLAASAWPGTKSTPASSRLPVWFQSSSCSLRTRALFSCTDKLVSSYPVHFSSRFPHSCLAASAWPGTKSTPASSRLPVWFQSSSCSLRTRALFSCTDKLVSSYPVHFSSRFPHGPQHTAHDATRRYPFHPESISPRETREEVSAKPLSRPTPPRPTSITTTALPFTVRFDPEGAMTLRLSAQAS